MRCPHCRRTIDPTLIAQSLGAKGGAAGVGAAKRRNLDYSAMGKKGAEAKALRRAQSALQSPPTPPGLITTTQ